MTSAIPSSPSSEPINDIPELHRLDVLYGAQVITRRPTSWNLQFSYPPRQYSADETKEMLQRILK